MPSRQLIPDVVRNQNLVLLPEKASVRAAVEIMAQRDIGAILIAERGVLRGIFTERDLLKRVVAPDLDLDSTRVVEVMTRNPYSLPPSATALEALRLMESRRIRHLPVVEDSRIMGIVSIRDLFVIVQANLEDLIKQYETIMFGMGAVR